MDHPRKWGMFVAALIVVAGIVAVPRTATCAGSGRPIDSIGSPQGSFGEPDTPTRGMGAASRALMAGEPDTPGGISGAGMRLPMMGDPDVPTHYCRSDSGYPVNWWLMLTTGRLFLVNCCSTLF